VGEGRGKEGERTGDGEVGKVRGWEMFWGWIECWGIVRGCKRAHTLYLPLFEVSIIYKMKEIDEGVGVRSILYYI